MLQAVHLVRRYSGSAVVNDVSFSVRPGEVLGYLGPNGSGKTTTIRMLTGLLDPSSGHVEFAGRRVDDDPFAFKRRLGYVPEEPVLYPFLSGREHLELVGRLRDLSERVLAARIDALLTLFGLGAAASGSIHSYSKGMKQRVLLAGALLHDPDVLIFDEPDSGLDVTTMQVLRHLIQRLASHGKIVLYSSHVLEVVERLCTRVIVIHRGTIVADDSVEHLRQLQSTASLEEVFGHLIDRDDPSTIAASITEAMALRG